MKIMLKSCQRGRVALLLLGILFAVLILSVVSVTWGLYVTAVFDRENDDTVQRPEIDHARTTSSSVNKRYVGNNVNSDNNNDADNLFADLDSMDHRTQEKWPNKDSVLNCESVYTKLLRASSLDLNANEEVPYIDFTATAGFDIQFLKCSTDSVDPRARLDELLEIYVRRPALAKAKQTSLLRQPHRLTAEEFLCQLQCPRSEPELDQAGQLLWLRQVELKRIWGYCQAQQVDALVWVTSNVPHILNCKTRVSGTRLWHAKLKLLWMLCQITTVPDVLYAFSNSDFAVPDSSHDWLQPMPDIVRYVGTPAHNSLLFPTGAFVEASMHNLIQLSDNPIEFSRLQQDMQSSPSRSRVVEVPWSLRKNVVWWRGSSTGVPHTLESFEYLPRLNIVERFVDLEGFDVGFIGGAPKIGGSFEALFQSNWYEKISPRQFAENKMILHCDGNTASFGLALKMTTKSLVLWVTSIFAYREFYYLELRPWHHYIPISTSMRELPAMRECLLQPHIAKEASAVAQRAFNILKARLGPDKVYCYVWRLLALISQRSAEPATVKALRSAGIPVEMFEPIDYFNGPVSNSKP